MSRLFRDLEASAAAHARRTGAAASGPKEAPPRPGLGRHTPARAMLAVLLAVPAGAAGVLVAYDLALRPASEPSLLSDLALGLGLDLPAAPAALPSPGTPAPGETEVAAADTLPMPVADPVPTGPVVAPVADVVPVADSPPPGALPTDAAPTAPDAIALPAPATAEPAPLPPTEGSLAEAAGVALDAAPAAAPPLERPNPVPPEEAARTRPPEPPSPVLSLGGDLLPPSAGDLPPAPRGPVAAPVLRAEGTDGIPIDELLGLAPPPPARRAGPVAVRRVPETPPPAPIIVAEPRSASPDESVAAFRRARAALEGGAYAEAVRRYDVILADAPDDPVALFGRAAAQQRLGDGAAARASYRRLLERDPENGPALANYLALVADEAPARAEAELRDLAARQGGLPPVHAQLARLQAARGDLPGAIQSATRAASLAPDDLFYRYNLAVLYDRAGRRREALEAYGRVLAGIEAGRPGAASLPGDDIRGRAAFLARRP